MLCFHRFEQIYRRLFEVKQRLCSNNSRKTRDSFRFIVAFAVIRLVAALSPVFSHYNHNNQLLSCLLDVPFHLKFIFNFYMELQLFVFCTMLEASFNSIRVRLSRLHKYSARSSLTATGLVIVDR
jgi:hypothetical protein